MTLSPGPVPLYHQLEQDLRERINAREFKAGEALPTEERICGEYGVSRITVRRALETLIAEGLITKRRGVGTFVTPPPESGVRSVRLSGSLDEFLASAGALATKVLSMQEIQAPDEAVRGLRLAPGEACTRLDLLSFLEDAPLGYHNLYLPLAIGRKIKPVDVGQKLPVIRMVEGKAGARVVRAEQFLEADIAGPIASKYLNLQENTPVLKVTRIYYDMTGAPVEMIVARNHPERYRYSIDFVAKPRIV
ncbi:HTH-type transcriptional repressor YvoA [Terricaulis silvestris]|uniref:HTH-type transcriptional repressor YvoA n=2 Tax=Terricaulis silvestris TaxID=2686094 RepID=A0A6I6MS20_9CAUL|nr:HTH-type transcriptional repressor YvoA [Terricaulis silvestris]